MRQPVVRNFSAPPRSATNAKQYAEVDYLPQPGEEDDEHKDLNFYGPTVIKKDGAVDAEKLFTTWATLSQ